MNKKIIIAFGISIFVGFGYLAYRKTAFGKTLKINWIIRRMTKNKERRNFKWKFPESLIREVKEELTKLDFEELELIEEYVIVHLRREGIEKVNSFREQFKENGILEKTELSALEHMLYNLFGISNGYREGRFKVNY